MREPVTDFSAFAAESSRPLFRTAWLLTGDWHLSEDLVQETLARMYRIWGGIGKIDNPAAYAHTVLVRAFLSHRRLRSSAERPAETLPDAGTSGPDAALRQTLVDALLTLPKRDRAVLERGVPAQPCTPGDPAFAGTCAVLPDGSRVQVSQGNEYPYAHTPNALSWTVDLLRPDGVEIELMEWNAPQEKGAAISRPAPPFTIAELTAIADSPRWQAQVAAAEAQQAASMFTPEVMPSAPTSPSTTPSK